MTKPRVIVTTASGPIAPFSAGYITLCDMLSDDYDLFASVFGIEGLEKGVFEPINLFLLGHFDAGAPYGADRNPGDIGKILDNVSSDDILIMMGGDNHLKVAHELHKAGVNVVGYPKTMDGDTSAFITCGWDTAVHNYATAIRNHHRTAAALKRVFFVGEFGRDRDGVLIPSAAWGGADRAIPSEGGVLNWEYHILPKIMESYEENGRRYKINGTGFPFAVVPFSEGAMIDAVPEPPGYMQDKDSHGEVKLQPEWIGLNLVYLMKQAGVKAAFQVYTYSGRDAHPTQTDLDFSKMACEEIVCMIRDKDFGKCAVFKPLDNGYITARAPLDEVAVKRSFLDSGLFDYEDLVPNKARLLSEYGNLFRDSLGNIPEKDELVYRTMQRS